MFPTVWFPKKGKKKQQSNPAPPKNFPRTSPPPLPSSPYNQSPEPAGVGVSCVANPPVPLKQTTPLTSSHDSQGIEHRPPVDSTGFTSWSSTVDSVEGSRSPSRGSSLHNPDQSNGLPGIYELSAWPWNKPPKRKPAIPPEQAERWAITRLVCRLFCEYVWLLIPIHSSQRVASAVVSTLGMTDDVKHEFPDFGVNPLWPAPKPELESAGCALIQIWRIVQFVDVGFTSLPWLGAPLTPDLIGEPFCVPSPHGTVRGHTVVHL